ncbi:FtsX-like permease family protein [compost metagenome]
MGIEPDKYLDFDNYLNWDKEEYKEFENGNLDDVVITEKIAEKVKLKKGDSFDMKVGTTNKSYNVVGIIDGKLYNGGSVVFINYKGLPKEYVDSASIQFYLNTTGRSVDVKENINKKIRALGGSVLTFEETKARNVENNKQLTDILSIFSFMSVVIGAFGVLNNIGISFIQRKKDLAVLSSVGMSKFQRNKMLIIESVLTVVWSIIIVTPFSYLGMSIMSKISKLLGFDMEVVFNIKFVPVIFLVSLAIVLIATIPVLFKSKKLSIIEELKYE